MFKSERRYIAAPKPRLPDLPLWTLRHNKRPQPETRPDGSNNSRSRKLQRTYFFHAGYDENMADAENQGKRAKTTLSALPATRDRLAAIATPDETVDETLNRVLDVYQSVRVRLRTAYEARTAAAQADPAAWSAGARMADALVDRATARRAARG